MPTVFTPGKTPNILNPATKSVFDNPFEKAIKTIAGIFAPNDPAEAVMDAINPLGMAAQAPVRAASKGAKRARRALPSMEDLFGGFGKAPDEATESLAKELSAPKPNARQLAERVEGIKAFHGSPSAAFGQFDMSKIGTGEGAQAFGRGLYFAEDVKIANFYRPRNPDTEEVLLGMLNAATDIGDDAGANVLEDALLHKTPDELLRLHPDQGAMVEKISRLPAIGSLTEVRIKAPRERLLDLDEFISQQPDPVRQGLETLGGIPPTELSEAADSKLSRLVEEGLFRGDDIGEAQAEVFESVARGLTPDEVAANLVEDGIELTDALRTALDRARSIIEELPGQEPTGMKALRFLEERAIGETTGEAKEQALEGLRQQFLDAGIRGNVFNDANSRVFPGLIEGGPKRNIVAFSDEDLEIIRQLALALGVGGGSLAAGAQLSGENEDILNTIAQAASVSQ